MREQEKAWEKQWATKASWYTEGKRNTDSATQNVVIVMAFDCNHQVHRRIKFPLIWLSIQKSQWLFSHSYSLDRNSEEWIISIKPLKLICLLAESTLVRIAKRTSEVVVLASMCLLEARRLYNRKWISGGKTSKREINWWTGKQSIRPKLTASTKCKW